jgi:hypothetical protein
MQSPNQAVFEKALRLGDLLGDYNSRLAVRGLPNVTEDDPGFKIYESMPRAVVASAPAVVVPPQSEITSRSVTLASQLRGNNHASGVLAVPPVHINVMPCTQLPFRVIMATNAKIRHLCKYIKLDAGNLRINTSTIIACKNGFDLLRAVSANT